MNTLDDHVEKKPTPSIRLKPKKSELVSTFSHPIPVKTPAGDELEPTIQMGDREYYELDLNQIPDEDVGKIARLYSGDRVSRKLNEAFALHCLVLVPSTWVRGAA